MCCHSQVPCASVQHTSFNPQGTSCWKIAPGAIPQTTLPAGFDARGLPCWQAGLLVPQAMRPGVFCSPGNHLVCGGWAALPLLGCGAGGFTRPTVIVQAGKIAAVPKLHRRLVLFPRDRFVCGQAALPLLGGTASRFDFQGLPHLRQAGSFADTQPRSQQVLTLRAHRVGRQGCRVCGPGLLPPPDCAAGRFDSQSLPRLRTAELPPTGCVASVIRSLGSPCGL